MAVSWGSGWRRVARCQYMIPSMPLFLTADRHVPVPLADTYARTWSLCPTPLRELFEPTRE